MQHKQNGDSVTFCRANFMLMGADLPRWIRHYGKRIAFLHLRAVRGTAERFEEVFHDEAAGELIETLRCCRVADFDGPDEPDDDMDDGGTL
jgi:mannonate dehydratase